MKNKVGKSRITTPTTTPRRVRQDARQRAGKTESMEITDATYEMVKCMCKEDGIPFNQKTLDRIVTDCLRAHLKRYPREFTREGFVAAGFTPSKAKLVVDDEDGSLYQTKAGQYFIWKVTPFLDDKALSHCCYIQEGAPELFGEGWNEQPMAGERQRRIRHEYKAVIVTDKEALEYVVANESEHISKFLRRAMKIPDTNINAKIAARIQKLPIMQTQRG